MSRSEEHPDELIDRERQGLLGPAERDRLEAHLAVCATCAFERRVSRMLTLEAKVPVDPAVLDRVVSSAIAAAHGPVPRTSGPTRATRIALASAAALAAGLAIAAMAGDFDAQEPPKATTASGISSPAAQADSKGERTVEAAIEPSPLPSGYVAEPFPLPALPPQAEKARATKNKTASRGSGPLEQPPPPEDSERNDAIPANATELFALANQARLRGSDDEALTLYRELSQRFPASREAIASRVVFGRLLLDSRRDAREALALFDGYLASSPEGTLAEEALVGRALSFERLGDTAGERDAWRTLIEKRPGSVHVDRARTRLRALGD